jgi:hypothetical protein
VRACVCVCLCVCVSVCLCVWADTATLVKSRAGTLGIYGVFRANCGVKGTCGVFDLLIFV